MAPVTVLESPLAGLYANASPYPADLLKPAGSGLCLFAARFYGVNDAIHMARAGMSLTLVDISERVLEMAEMYGCDATLGDAWDFAESARETGATWDAVSVDCYTGDANTRALRDLALWCSLARDVVTGTHVSGQPYTLPEGWNDELFVRKARGGVNWLVLTRA